MHARTPVIASSTSPYGRPAPLVPRCPGTLLTKPECHCPACLLEQIAAHGTPTARARVRAATAEAQAPAGAIL